MELFRRCQHLHHSIAKNGVDELHSEIVEGGSSDSFLYGQNLLICKYISNSLYCAQMITQFTWLYITTSIWCINVENIFRSALGSLMYYFAYDMALPVILIAFLGYLIPYGEENEVHCKLFFLCAIGSV